MFQIANGHDVQALSETFRRQGWLQVQGFLGGEGAQDLYRNLRGRGDWKQVLTVAEGAVELDRQTRAAMPPGQKLMLDDAVYAAARKGFQYRYESVRVPDSEGERATMADLVAEFAEWLSRGDARDFLHTVTNVPTIEFADAQATAYAPGDFLTGHDDGIPGKQRRAAYVFGLTPVWRLEWGGLLMFHGSDGNVSHGLTPSFNTLNLFAVPTMHSVSEVTRAAAYRRYAITGWLREGDRQAQI